MTALLHMTPEFSSENHPDVRLPDSELVADCGLAVPLSCKTPDTFYLRFGEALPLLGLCFLRAAGGRDLGSGNVTPEYASADLADVGFAEPELLGDAALRLPGSLEAVDLSNVRLRDRRMSVRFTRGFVHEARFLCAAVVLLGRHVLKVVEVIVRLVRIDVIDFTSALWPYERAHDEVVYECGASGVVPAQTDPEVALARTTHFAREENVSDLTAVPVQAPYPPHVTHFVQSTVADHWLPRFLEGVASPLRLLHT